MSTTVADQGHIERARLWLKTHDYRLTPGLEDIEIAGLLAAAEIEGEARHGIGANNPPAEARIDPEKLIDVASLPALLEAEYQPLLARGAELLEGAEVWLADHAVPAPDTWPKGKPWPAHYALRGPADNDTTSELLKQAATWAGGKADRKGNVPAGGEIDEARRTVKRAPWDACKAIDEWFNGKRARLREIWAIADEAQIEFKLKVEREERADRERLAAVAAAKAKQALEDARAAGGDDIAVEAAVDAEEAAARAQARAAAPIPDVTRSTSMAGVTSSLGTTWGWKMADKGALILAAAAPLVQRLLWTIPAIATNPELQKAITAALKLDDPASQVSLDLVMENGPNITAVVRSKTGRRHIAGLEIFEQHSVSRR